MKKRLLVVLLLVALSTFVCINVSADNIGNISGKIVNDDYEPIANATIKVISGPTLFRTTSNSNGEYVLENLVPGIYEIEVSSSTYISQQISGINVISDKNTPISIVLKSQPLAPGAISGKVVDDSNKNLGGVLVQVMNEVSSKSTLTSNSGEYSFKDVSAGKYEISFSKDGYISKRLINIEINPAQDRNNINTVLFTHTGEISGTIFNLQGAIIPEATVKVLEDSTKVVYTDQNGKYHITDLKPGIYNLEISSSGYINSKISNIKVEIGKISSDINTILELPRGSISGSVSEKQGASLIGAKVEIIEGPTKKTSTVDSYGYYILQDLIPGTYSLEISFPGYNSNILNDINVVTMKDTFNTNTTLISMFGSISGTITSAFNNIFIENAIIEILGENSKQVKTNSSGKYVLDGLKPGIYNIRISKSGYETKQIYNIVVEASKDSVADEKINSLSFVSGKISGKFNVPIAGAKIEIIEGPIRKFSVSDFNGIFILENLLPGAYVITVEVPGYVSHQEKDIIVQFNENIFDLNLTLNSQYGSISGSIKNSINGKQILGAQLKLEGPTNKTILTNSDGKYRFDNLPPGTYSITISDTSYVTKTLFNIIVESSKDVTTNIELDPRGSLSGKISTEDSNANLALVTIKIEGPMKKSFVVNFHNNPSPFGKAEFNFPDLDPGNYNIIIIPDDYLFEYGYLMTENTFLIESGKETYIELILITK